MSVIIGRLAHEPAATTVHPWRATPRSCRHGSRTSPPYRSSWTRWIPTSRSGMSFSADYDGRHGVEGFLMAMAVQQRALSFMGARLRLEASLPPFPRQKFLKQQRVAGDITRQIGLQQRGGFRRGSLNKQLSSRPISGTPCPHKARAPQAMRAASCRASATPDGQKGAAAAQRPSAIGGCRQNAHDNRRRSSTSMRRIDVLAFENSD